MSRQFRQLVSVRVEGWTKTKIEAGQTGNGLYNPSFELFAEFGELLF
jgi:hypothetical protein